MPNVLPPGTQAPDFTLPVTPDQKLSLQELRGHPVILAFYPADWSPVCGDQMALYNEVLPEFQKFGAELMGVSVDGVWCHRAFAEARHLHFPLELNQIHLALKRSQQLIRWMYDTEVHFRNELTDNRYAKDYDAVVTVRNDGCERTFALEYERTPKARKEYLDISANIAVERAVDRFLYLVPNYDLISFLVGC